MVSQISMNERKLVFGKFFYTKCQIPYHSVEPSSPTPPRFQPLQNVLVTGVEKRGQKAVDRIKMLSGLLHNCHHTLKKNL